MYVCMYVGMYIGRYVCMYACMYICMYVSKEECYPPTYLPFECRCGQVQEVHLLCGDQPAAVHLVPHLVPPTYIHTYIHAYVHTYIHKTYIASAIILPQPPGISLSTYLPTYLPSQGMELWAGGGRGSSGNDDVHSLDGGEEAWTVHHPVGR